MLRRRHIRVALQIAVVTVTVVFILSFFPGTPSSVYSADDVDIAAIRQYESPVPLKSSSPVVAVEATATPEAHSNTHGKGQPVQGHDQPPQGKEDSVTPNTEKSGSEKVDTGKDGGENTGSQKTYNENAHAGKTKQKLDKGKTDTENTSDGETSDNLESDPGETTKDKSKYTKPESSHNSKEDGDKSKDTETSVFEGLGTEKPKTYKKPKPYGGRKEIAPPLTSHSFAKVILDPEESGPSRLGCPPVNTARYRHLLARKPTAKNWKGELKRKYYFALDLFECQSILPTLLGAIVETIKYLGPENCALSIVEGRSRDWTYDILEEVGEAMEEMGVKFNLTTNPIDPLSEDVDRIVSLAELRNQALQPLYDNPEDYTADSLVLFINDITPCVDDILELVHQLDIQKADLTCSMDWQSRGSVLYDFWVSRAINGDSFFEIPQNGAWDFSQNMFWNEPTSKERMEAMQPVQVYACWNGMVVFKSKPLLKDGIRFRGQRENECYMGEPTYLAKDFWTAGHGRIAIVPSVNVAYTLTEAIATKKYRGYVDEVVEFAAGTEVEEWINWQEEPPAMVKCAKTWDKPSWVPPL